MRKIEVAEDVYQHLLRSAVQIGEDASSILRRLLNLDEQPTVEGGPSLNEPGPSPSDQLRNFAAGPALRARRNVTDRYLAILGFVVQQRPEHFERVFEIGGRRRRYFGRNRDEVARSGKSVHPREIPGTPYWALTNLSTGDKKTILTDALKLMGYSAEAIQAAVAAVSQN